MGTRLRHVGPSLSSCLLLLLQLLLPFPSAADPHSSPPHHANFHPSKAVVITGTILTFILFLCLLSFFLQRCRPSDTSRRRPLVARRWAAASRRGLDAEVVESFPTMVYSEVKGLKAERRSAGKLECAVCLCEFEDEDTLRLLPKCSHAFHPECIGMWLESHITCPVCRANLKDLATVPAQAPPPSSCTLPGAEGAEPSQAENDGGEQITRESVVISVDDGDDETGRAAVHDGSSSWTEEEQERFTLRLPESTREGVTGRELRRSMTIAVVRKSGFGEEGEGISGVEKGAKASSTRSDRWAFLARTFSLRGFNGAGAGAGVGHPGDKGEEESPADGIV